MPIIFNKGLRRKEHDSLDASSLNRNPSGKRRPYVRQMKLEGRTAIA